MVITLTTDFGYSDPFVGIMKGVIATINPAARIIDVTHGVRPQDVMAAALIVRHSIPYFPSPSIHVVVVDPGVGSNRRPLLVVHRGYYLIGPDNGVLTLALGGETPERIVCLSNPSFHLGPAAATFHGRDIFAPVAAHLSLGAPPEAFGDSVDSLMRLHLTPVTSRGGVIEGEIIYIDGFGNLFTNIDRRNLAVLADREWRICVNGASIHGVAPHYSAGANHELVAVVNSWGVLEIAVFQGNAQQRLGAKVGDKVRLRADR